MWQAAGLGSTTDEDSGSTAHAKRAPEDYVQLLADPHENLYGQLPDGTWERLSRDGR